MSPEDRAGHLARYGWQAAQANDLEGGVIALREATALVPSVADYWSAYGIALAKTFRLAEAVDALRRCLSLDPANVQIWCIVGEISLDRGDYNGAAVALKRCLELDPNATHPSGLRARALIKRGERQLRKK
ncbi:MAG: tetratricopeptide repeat protein [Deltaproteobacteria bacterium]|nr:tetratricopeptide repeat protein [Deltaproteobacteria bacterium]